MSKGRPAQRLIILCDPAPAAALSAVPAPSDAAEETYLLCMRPGLIPPAGAAPGWRPVAPFEGLDVEALRNGFLEFVDSWPRRPIRGGRSFDELFRLDGRYSVWWSGYGLERHPDKGVFPDLRTLWMLGSAIDRIEPGAVYLYTREPRLAAALAGKCRAKAIALHPLPGSAVPGHDACGHQAAWIAKSVAWLFTWPILLCLRALLARAVTGLPRARAAERDVPTLVLTLSFPRHVRMEGGSPRLWFLDEVDQALERRAPAIRRRYLLHSIEGEGGGARMVAGVWHTRWPLLRRVEGRTALPEAFPCLLTVLRSIPGQIAAILRLARVERSPAYRATFVFSDLDVAGYYIPLLRHAVSRMAAWERACAAVAAALRSAGNVRALVVNEEFYVPGMIDIAAARRQGIPTIGLQHGTIFPMHLIYTLPPGQVANAPLPDRFAAFGPYAREVVSGCGAFPADRVWITGCPRFDRLTNQPRETRAARSRLGLPDDRFIILFASQFYPWFPDAARTLLEITRSDPGILVCIKTHTADVSLDVYRRIAAEAGAPNTRLYTDRFDDLLTACDLLISSSSTTVFEAIVLGRLTISLNFSNEPDRFPYVADGGSLGARSPEELRAALARARDPREAPALLAERQRFLARHAGPSARGEAAATFVAELVRHCFPDVQTRDREGAETR